MGIFDPIAEALGGQPQQPQASPSNTQITKLTPRDIEIAKQRRAQSMRDNPGAYAFHPPAPSMPAPVLRSNSQ